MLSNLLSFLKDNVKVVITVVALGFTVTLGWAKGCTVSTDPQLPVPVTQPAAP